MRHKGVTLADLCLKQQCFVEDRADGVQVLQQLCSLSLRSRLTSLTMACNGVSFETLSLTLALPHLRCLALDKHAVRYIMTCCLLHACQN